MLNLIANSELLAAIRRAILSRLPFMQMESDVSNIIYLNWVIESRVSVEQIPQGVSLIEKDGKTILTALTYNHGHFGPSFLGRIRKLLPSPIQSNWRFYVSGFPNDNGATKVVFFIKNTFSSVIYSVITRVFSDALPSHVAKLLQHTKQGGAYTTRIESGKGSAPELFSVVKETDRKVLPPDLERFFSSWGEAVSVLSLQDSAICPVEGLSVVAHAGISLPIETSNIVPLEVMEYVPGEYLKSLGATGQPFSYLVPNVKFRVLWEKLQ
ncbi:MAG: DUF2071 domain-containing protein [Gammaproteobacteria bacterium]|nr:DUF2071 domain-containing protein [Gammaproteobacteria bacterium]